MRLLPLAAITLLIGILTLNRLGASDVCGGSEAAMAVYVQEMIAQHQLLFPLDNCTIPMYKPPLYHWTATGLAALLHETAATPFNLRLPSAVYAIGGAILTMALASVLLGPRGTILAGLILCGSYQYISQARIGLVDMTLTFYETLALYAFLFWLILGRASSATAKGRAFAHYVFAAAMGLGVLAKGPVGAILPGAAILLFLLIERDWPELLALLKPGPLILGGVIASSWYLACLAGGRYDFLHLQIGSENFGRFFGSLGAMPPWYYVQPLLLNSLPLSLVVPIAIVTALLPWHVIQRSPAPTTAELAGEGETTVIVSDESDRPASLAASAIQWDRGRFASSAARFLAIFWVVTVIFFNLAAFKRRAYLLPLWPPSAFVLAWWITDHLMPRLSFRIGAILYRSAIAMCLLLAFANLLFIPAYELHGCGAPFSLASLFRWPSNGFAGESSNDADQRKSYRRSAAEVDRLTKPGAPLYSYGFQDALEPLIFYLGRCAPPLRPPFSIPPDACVIAPAPAANQLERRAPGLAPLANIAGYTPLVLFGSVSPNDTCLSR